MEYANTLIQRRVINSLSLSMFLLIFPLNVAFGFNSKKTESPLPNSIHINQNLFTKISAVPEPPLDGEGRPSSNISGGGTRGNCSQDADLKPEVTLLIPDNQQGLTVEKYPTFFVFVPQTKANKGEFVLYDRTEKKLIYRTTFQLSSLPGIVRIQLPKTQPYLKISNNYEWRFLLHCKPNDERAEDVMKIGLIKRVAPNEAIIKILGTPNALEKVRVYQKNLIWYDALQTLAELDPTSDKNSNVKTMWQELLQGEKSLQEIVSYPLINCCKPAN